MTFALPRTGSLKTRGQVACACVAIGLLAVALFGGAVRNGLTSWDDDLYVTRNPVIRDASLQGIARVFTTHSICNYHPLTMLSFMVEHALVGCEPWLYHLDNVLLHAAASVLAFLLARRWLRNDGGAFAAVVLFLAHPLRVESVAWVAERKDVLCGAFFLASLLAYTAHVEKEDARGRRGAYAASLGLFLCALLSKVMAVTLPGVLAFFLTVRGGWNRRRLLGLLPFAALSIVFAWIGAVAQTADGAVQGLHGGALGTHLLTVLKALAFYAEKLVWPVRLSPRYVLEPARGIFDPLVVAGALIVLLVATAAILSFRGRRTVLLGLLFFGVTWAPVSGIVPLSTIVADRYLYLPSFGLCMIAGAVLEAQPRPIMRLALRCALISFVVFFACLTPARVADWRDGETLWTEALRENSENPFAYNQLALSYLESGRYGDAAAAARESTRLGLGRPEHVFNLCLAYRGLADREREIATAREILAASPDFVPAWLVVLRQLTEEARLDECDRLLARLLAEYPDDAGLYAARAGLEEAHGNVEGALCAYLRSIELRQGDPETLLGAAVMLARLGDFERAVTAAERTLTLPGGVLPPGARTRLRELVLETEKRGGPELAERARRLERGPPKG